MLRGTVTAVVGCLLSLACCSEAYYLPGVNPQSFEKGDPVKLKVNSLTSTKTLLPINYYRLPFCQPDEGVKKFHENLGEFLSGDRIENSPYKINMLEHVYCAKLCVQKLGKPEQAGQKSDNLQKAIRKNYHNNWIVDNLPSASKAEDETTVTTRYWQGFPIGFVSGGKAYINNHVNIEIMYHPTGEAGKYRVVRFTVEPFSIKHQVESGDEGEEIKITNAIESCAEESDPKHTDYNMIVSHDRQLASGNVLFTYDVDWEENLELEWASRWDIYLTMDDAIPAKVHWMSIVNSLIIVTVLSAMIVAILVRNLRRDFARYNALATDDEKAEDLEEFGWKLVHADVFRPPTFSPLLLSVIAGTGAQILAMTFLTIIVSAMGFTSPANRGALLMAELFLFVLMGGLAGYVTARLYKSFDSESAANYKTATLMTALGFPGISFGFFFLMDLIAVGYHSTDAVPFTTMLILLVLWLGISTPLVFFGAYLGYKQDPIAFPTKTSRIPRPIPPQPWFMSTPFTLFIGGILPFGACFVEMYFILASVWMNQYYYVFGFLLLVYLILIVTCAEITVLFNYFQLCGENYNWWWRSFATAGSTALHVFIYSFFYFKQLEASSFATYVLYFGYMGFVCTGLFMMTGFIGLISCLWFNLVIFGTIKID